MLKSLEKIFSNRKSISLMLFVLNVFVYLKIGFATFLELSVLSLIYLIPIALTLFVTLFLLSIRSNFKVWFLSACLVPGFVSGFLVLNFVFSHSETTETFYFNKEMQYVGRSRGIGSSGMSESTMIILEGNAYDAYKGIRMFLDYEAIKHRHRITYTFAQGLFGFRVMKDYELK